MQAVEQEQSDASRDYVVHSSRSITRRLIYSLALLPIVPAISTISVTLIIEQYGRSKQFDGFRWFHLIFSTFFVLAMILIWKRTIVWTLGKKWLTVLVGMIPFLQAVYGISLVTFTSTGCIDLNIRTDVLRVSQHEMSIGLWVWISIWVWWGWEKWKMFKMKQEKEIQVKSISPVAKRIIASIGSIPIVFSCFLICNVITDSIRSASPDSMVITYALSAAVAVYVWITIWRKTVEWSTTMIRKTILLALFCFVLPITVFYIFLGSVGRSNVYSAILFMFPVIGWGLWMAMTVHVWTGKSFTSTSGDTSPRCMKCGYLLRGLTATRCPECGDEPTLDVLWASMVDEL